jgi:hypothetical protein
LFGFVQPKNDLKEMCLSLRPITHWSISEMKSPVEFRSFRLFIDFLA